MTGVAELAEGHDVNWRELTGAVPNAVLVGDPTGTIVYVNAAAERLFGYKPEALLGRPIETLVPKQFHARHKAHQADCHVEPRRQLMCHGADLRGVRADGSEFPVAISLGFTPSTAGNLVIAIVQDLSGRRSREHSVQESHDRMALEAELKEVNKELESFSFSVSHDLRSPLRVVDGFSQILMEDYAGKLDDYGRDCLGRIRQAAQRMGQLIDDLLGLSRITRSELIATDVDLGKIAREIINGLIALNPDRAVQFTIAEGLLARGDANLLRIVLDNLIGNSFKFSGSRSLAVIEVGQTDTHGVKSFYVRDNGAGFDMTHADKIFGAFQRLHSQKDIPGNGIGLATVQRVINRHNGRVWTESAPDKGATFYFTLFQEGRHEDNDHTARRG